MFKMKITKYPQSCVLIETKGKKILIDPGNLVYDQTDIKPEDFKDIDIIPLTHKHSDHCFPEALKIIKENNPNVIILANKEVNELLKTKNIDSELINIKDIKEYDRIKIEIVKAQHGYLPAMGDKGFPKDNNGYVIDDGEKILYDCGDTLSFQNKIKADIVLVPISGHAVVMEPLVAVEFCQAINPELVIPIHYDSPKHPRGTDKFEQEIKKTNLNYKILKNKEHIEV